MKRLIGSVFVLASLGVPGARASGDYYAGGVAGLATLSVDAQSMITVSAAQVSTYKPENGAAVNLFFGRYVGNYVSVQANYIRNTNDLTFVSSSVSPEGSAFYQQRRGSSQSSGIADVLVFFRARDSRLRPYLSTGVGLVHVQSSVQTVNFFAGPTVVPAGDFSANTAGLRVAVGIDVKLGAGFSLRYSFSESISANPISDHLSPPAQRALKNFQNLWGFVKSF